MILKTLTLVFMFIIRLRFPKSSSLIEVIRKRYGEGVVKLVRAFEKCNFKCLKLQLDIDFLVICQQHKVIPKFLQFRIANCNLRRTSTYQHCQIRLLNEEIKIKKKNLKSLEKEFTSLKRKLFEAIGFLDFNHVSNITLSNNEKSISKCKHTHDKKLTNLIPGYKRDSGTFLHDPEKVIFNFSSKVLSASEKSLLCKGLNFAIPPKNIDYADFLTQFELLYRDTLTFELTSENREFLKSKLKDICFSTITSYDFNSVPSNLSKSEFEALKGLIESKYLVIQKSDKGNNIVVSDRENYIKGVKSLLLDNSKFTDSNIDSTKWLNYVVNLEIKLKDHFKILRKENKLSDEEFQKISPIGSRPGILYGLPKVHKAVINNIPKFRPILSAINTPTYKLAKFLVPILSSLTVNEYTVKDSFHFAEEILTFDHTLCMASLDVESLFTNIPLEETIINCVDDLFSHHDYHGKLSKNELHQLIKLATTESFFIFDDKMYKQLDGVSMGSPLGPTLANAFLCHYEKLWLEECPPEFKPVVYRRYVDDIFVLFKSDEHLSSFVNYMNSKHISMKFTSENENSNCFSFLDVKITRCNEGFSTSVFRKPTFSGVFTNFDSFIFHSYKIGLLHTLLFRCFTICSSMQNFHLEIEKLRHIFKQNNYPTNIIDHCIKTFLNKIFVAKKLVSTVPKKELVIILPFLGNFSMNLRKRIFNSFSKTLPQCCVKVIFQSKNRLGNFFRFKDAIPLALRSHLIYKYTCSNCNVTYYGETERHLQIRAGEHLSISALTNKRVNNTKRSAVKDHCLFYNHGGGFEDFSVLTYESNRFKLLIKEALLVSRDNLL